MIKTNLPVILLRGVVLLPHSEIRLEITNDIDKKIIDLAEQQHDNYILLVSPPNLLEKEFQTNQLPKIGMMGKINLKMELENGVTRIIIEGVRRLNIYEYYNNDNSTLSAKVGNTTKFAITPKDEMTLLNKVIKELESYINNVSDMSNSIIAQVSNIKNISKASDLIASYLPISFERKLEYLQMINPYTRILMVLEDIKKEQELVAIEDKINTEVRRQLDQSQKEFILREKMRIIKEELGEINLKEDEVEEIKNDIDNLNAPIKIKERLYTELKRYEMLPPSSPETSMVRVYIDWLLNLPWNIYTKDHKDLKKARHTLDRSHHGLEQIKNRIIEFLAVNQMTNNLKSPIICLVGPPGVGKTSLARSIANSIGRKFIKISVGGVNDEAEIIGHRRAYIGSSPGRIISGIKKAGSSNPVFLIDEIDKMTKDYRGDPASALLEVLDPEQNQYFCDNYLDEEYDLSKIMFILTANDLYQIPEPLRDRLEIIELTGYTEYEKLDIAKKHLIPNKLDEHGLNNKTLKIKDKIISLIINSYTKEAGVRELERLIATICRKVVTNIISNNKKEKIYNISSSDLEEYLGKKKYFHSINDLIDKVGVANGLAYTKFGGDILPIEVTFYKGKGNLLLTGSLGEVIKESANIALSYIKTHYDEFNINYNLLEENDIHIHLPEGAVPKDGPSAGVTLTTALISALTNQPVPHQICMTGEITLRGQILPIGGLKEKTIGAHRSGLKQVIIPKDNERDLNEIPNEIKKDLEFFLVNEYKDVYNIVYFTSQNFKTKK
ncbi:MAG: endopeptidase La [Bacilli bacterium]|nr:endopeptidase La [Bacilli bacterium]